MEERPPVWSVAGNILNKQSLTADKRLSSSLGFGPNANNFSTLKRILLRNIHRKSLGPGLGRPRRRWEDNIKMDLRIFRKLDVEVWTGSSWLWIGTCGGHL